MSDHGSVNTRLARIDAEARADQWKAAFGIKHGLDDPEVAAEYVKALIENEGEAQARAERYREALDKATDALYASQVDTAGFCPCCSNLMEGAVTDPDQGHDDECELAEALEAIEALAEPEEQSKGEHLAEQRASEEWQERKERGEG